MPRTTLPLTPAPSMDISGRDGQCKMLNAAEKGSFALPPPAIAPASSFVDTASQYSLPPPPTRTRKIIQMTPKLHPDADAVKLTSNTKARSKAPRDPTAARKTAAKKQPSSTSQAGKKIARKTAHSVIERRRRSKMNEEFGVLKNMIPACKDQEMHKLAILQASIDYLRYLEQCITDVRTVNGAKMDLESTQTPMHLRVFVPPEHRPDSEELGEDTDIEITGSAGLSPSISAQNGHGQPYMSPHSATSSPSQDVPGQNHTTSYTSSLSGLPSPAMGSRKPGLGPQYSHSTSTSPTLIPTSKEADEEATAALLMLNRDRRNTNTSSNSSNGRSMSVKDLLSS